MNAVVSVVSVSAVCDQVDQGDQVVPAHQVDDIDEVHELDPVHRATSGDFCATLGQKNKKTKKIHLFLVPFRFRQKTLPLYLFCFFL